MKLSSYINDRLVSNLWQRIDSVKAGDNREVTSDAFRPLAAGSVEHPENFPVASWLCPPQLRPAISALYHYARTADDLADEGSTSAAERLSDLAAYRAELLRMLDGAPPGPRWAHVFGPLQRVQQEFRLPLPPLLDLLDAFTQDVVMTRDQRSYATQAELLDYCRRSANPVGRLLLHLYGVDEPSALAQSDAICTALQLINFWQDLSVDLPRNRHYLPDDACQTWGVSRQQLEAGTQDPQVAALIAQQVQQARALMLSGAPLVFRLPGRIGWELRLVVQGGLRILDKITQLNHATLTTRPHLSVLDLPLIFWRAWRMSRPR